jgi:hypothetical protein
MRLKELAAARARYDYRRLHIPPRRTICPIPIFQTASVAHPR